MLDKKPTLIPVADESTRETLLRMREYAEALNANAGYDEIYFNTATLLAQGVECPRLRRVFTGGEALAAPLRATLLQAFPLKRLLTT